MRHATGPRPEVDDLPPRRIFPGVKRPQPIPADAHHRRPVAGDRHRTPTEQPARTERAAPPSACRIAPRGSGPTRAATRRPTGLQQFFRIARGQQVDVLERLALLDRGQIVEPPRLRSPIDREEPGGARRPPTRRTAGTAARRAHRQRCGATSHPRTPGRARRWGGRPRCDPSWRAFRAGDRRDFGIRCFNALETVGIDIGQDVSAASAAPIVLQRRPSPPRSTPSPPAADRAGAWPERRCPVAVIRPLKLRSISLFAEAM